MCFYLGARNLINNNYRLILIFCFLLHIILCMVAVNFIYCVYMYVYIVSLDQLVAVVAFRGRQSFGDGPAACLQGSFEVLFG